MSRIRKARKLARRRMELCHLGTAPCRRHLRQRRKKLTKSLTCRRASCRRCRTRFTARLWITFALALDS